MPKIFGIDLGTTYSCIAVVDEKSGRPELLKNQETSQAITPSAVFFEGADEFTVGETAKGYAKMYPEAVAAMFKREMCKADWSFDFGGIKYTPEMLSALVLKEVVAQAQQQVSEPICDVVITCPAWFGINQRDATAAAGKLAGLNVVQIINEPTAAAISYGLDSSADEVVLVYDLGGGTFDITMIEIKANCIDVICTGGNHYLGGHEWDTKIVNYMAEQFCASKGGDPKELLDDSETRQDLFLKAEGLKKRLGAREKEKERVIHGTNLLDVEVTRDKFEELTRPHLEETITLTKQMLREAAEKRHREELARSHLAEMSTLTEQALRDAAEKRYQEKLAKSLTEDDVLRHAKFNRILLVGGSTLMPQVEKRLVEEFHVECKRHDPHEAVAKGAALYGWKVGLDKEYRNRVIESYRKALNRDLTKEEETKFEQTPTTELPKEHRDAAAQGMAGAYGLSTKTIEKTVATTIRNVTSRSFGILIIDEKQVDLKKLPQMKDDEVPMVMSVLINRNDKLPIRVQKKYGTVLDKQSGIMIRLVESLSTVEPVHPDKPPNTVPLDETEELKKVEMPLPPGLPLGAEIEVTFELVPDGRLTVIAKDVTSGKELTFDADASSRLSEEEMAQAMAQVSHLKRV